MLDDLSSPSRRISPAARALRPVQHRIGELQQEIAFLIARNLYAMRQPADRVGEAEVAEKRQALAEVTVELEATITQLPEELRTDHRLRDTRAALERLDHALDILGNSPEAAGG
ncbi:MAG: hypothetical protein ACTHLT_20065 [Devosia sp.]